MTKVGRRDRVSTAVKLEIVQLFLSNFQTGRSSCTVAVLARRRRRSNEKWWSTKASPSWVVGCNPVRFSSPLKLDRLFIQNTDRWPKKSIFLFLLFFPPMSQCVCVVGGLPTLCLSVVSIMHLSVSFPPSPSAPFSGQTEWTVTVFLVVCSIDCSCCQRIVVEQDINFASRRPWPAQFDTDAAADWKSKARWNWRVWEFTLWYFTCFNWFLIHFSWPFLAPLFLDYHRRWT